MVEGEEDLIGSSLCLTPTWVVSSGNSFTTGKLFVPDSPLSLLGMLLGDGIHVTVIGSKDCWVGGVGS